jgi:antitoxin (DNA-binding transcriptional repressor) of toxin-antitoxin stability system
MRAAMTTLGILELKRQLGRCLKRVRAGERLLKLHGDCVSAATAHREVGLPFPFAS